MLIICTLCILLTKINAQTPDTSTTEKLLHYIMQPLDKSQIPTGYLQEFGCPIVSMATFNGSLTDKNRIDMNLWRTLYFQLQTGYCGTGTNLIPNIKIANNTINLNKATNIPIPVLIGNYNTVKHDAFSSNLLSYNSSTNQVFDVSGRAQNPYQLNNLFASCPNQSYSKTGTETFICNNNLVWNNTGQTINLLQIDFADGNGFQTIAMGSPITVNFPTVGKIKWIIKVTLSDNTVMQCYAPFYVAKAYSNNTSNNFIPYNGMGGITTPIWWINNNPSNNDAKVTVNYSLNNYTGTLRKPLIVVKGFDPENTYHVYNFISSLINEANPFDFNGHLDDGYYDQQSGTYKVGAGYDLVFVDFNNALADIKDNAAIVENVIRLVNANKVVDDRNGNIIQKNVVMGVSMGGLCARYALAEMTKTGKTTDTRLLITHDSPHKGANVPLGLQYLIQMMGGFQLFGYGVRDIYPQYDQSLNLLNAPATQQMLIYRSTGANNYVENTFLNGDYKNMVTFSGSLQPTYRFIATANGNECANPIFNLLGLIPRSSASTFCITIVA